MIYLDAQKELDLLSYLRHTPMIDHGASRMLFAANDTVKSILCLDSTKDYVVKVAIGLGGMKQNGAEADMFINYGETGYLAKIYLIGRYTIIMEQVDPDDYTDLADCISSDWEEDFNYYCDDYDIDEDDENYPQYREAAELIGFLASKQGCTSDNGQVGRAADGKLVAYDYGFSRRSSTDSQTSCISHYMDDDEYRLKYMSGLMDILEKEGALMRSVDDVDYSLDTLEQDIRDYIDNDETEYNEEDA